MRQPDRLFDGSESTGKVIGLALMAFSPALYGLRRGQMPHAAGWLRQMRFAVPSITTTFAGMHLAHYLPSFEPDLQHRRMMDWPMPWYGYLMIPLVAYPRIGMRLLRPPTISQCLQTVYRGVRTMPESLPPTVFRLGGITGLAVETYNALTADDDEPDRDPERAPSGWPNVGLNLLGAMLALGGGVHSGFARSGTGSFFGRAGMSYPGLAAFMAGALIIDRTRGVYFDTSPPQLGYGRVGDSDPESTPLQFGACSLFTAAALGRIGYLCSRMTALSVARNPLALFYALAGATSALAYGASTASTFGTTLSITSEADGEVSHLALRRHSGGTGQLGTAEELGWMGVRGVAFARLLLARSWLGLLGGHVLIPMIESSYAARTFYARYRQQTLMIEDDEEA